MIQVLCRDNQIVYNAYHLVKAFFPNEDVKSKTDEKQTARIRLVADAVGDGTDISPGQCRSGKAPAKDIMPVPKELIAAENARELYLWLKEYTGKELPWGMLTGVRPVKLASAWLEEQGSDYASMDIAREAFVRWFCKERFVSREKAELAFCVAWREREILRNILTAETNADRDAGYSLYIGIPFCPSICSYCSFSSGSIGQYRDRVEPYLAALCRELEETAKHPGYPTTIYMGGGTPTSLSAEQLRLLLERAGELFHIREGLAEGKILEYTVEAGRPDSITREKLEVLREMGVTRISINPQTMQQKTLDLIGRKHTTTQIREAFFMAREMGFDNINMDLIAGLPGESREDMQDTLRQIMQMAPDSLTVHSLAIKRASAIGIAQKTGRKIQVKYDGQLPLAGKREMTGDGSNPGQNLAGKENDEPSKTGTVHGQADIAGMIQDAGEAAKSMGMEPYYLYRQKSIAGNFENIGYARPGREGLYNILIMEEVQSILACGAGASTKLVSKKPVPNEERGGQETLLIRRENVKNIDEYIRRFQAL